ncbi:hypothetical protein ASG43_17405 [Aureimonas sp. Leaf454]|uniref:IS1595 family transposase n=1 Tax=Aureimonas sp. Leaf454 TaxID=1736381 RepID=UPI0006FFD000|nr:IS1595 family transposase [Aureimonas sp. Leaf454]KQT42052.1 hypothetical protein ASG43_17405 [Aureimonas sp. Leaf454]
MDGKYAGGHVKQANRAEDRIDCRLKRHQNMKRVCVLALREKNARDRERTFTRIVREENGPAAFANVTHHVDCKAVVATDEHPSYNDIVAKNEHRQVNHSEAFRTNDGVNTNHVESFFSRVERAYVGIHHHFSLKYFDWYMADVAWREDNRKRDNGRLTAMVLMTVMQAPTSRDLCGYWQGYGPPELDFSDVLKAFKPI